MANRADYPDDFEKLKGMPCALQFFTRTMCDEECLEMVRVLDKTLKNGA